MPNPNTTPIQSYPRTWAGDITPPDEYVRVHLATIATTGSQVVNVVAPVTGVLRGFRMGAKDALAAHATNNLSFGAVNKGSDGLGTTQMLGAGDLVTTKAGNVDLTTGYKSAAVPLSLVAGATNCNAGDVIEVTLTSNGTLPNTLTQPTLNMVFRQT